MPPLTHTLPVFFWQDACDQDWHADFPVYDKTQLEIEPATAWPVLQEGAELDLVCMGLSLLVEKGLRAVDIVVFDGHVVHRGKSYGLRHVGMHAYLDVPGVVRQRDVDELGSFRYVQGPHLEY